MEPSYLSVGVDEIRRRASEAVDALESCEICPRNCRVNRLAGDARVCSTGRLARVSTAFPHFGEEDCLRGTRGSGTIFFSFCNLKCVFCQNHDASQGGQGRELTARQIASVMLGLQRHGCHNINFVTPEHVVPQVLEAIAEAVDAGLKVPIVYNTSSYDSMESLRWMDGVVDIYMPDFKVWTAQSGQRFLKAKDYREVACRAVREMHRQVGPLRINDQGLAVRGVLVRHLVMPGMLDETGEILRFLHDEISPDTYVNVMGQYRPEHRSDRYPEIDRLPTQAEMQRAHDLFAEAGLTRRDTRRLPIVALG